MEIVIAVIIACTAIYLLYRNITKKASGKCGCENCTHTCCMQNKDSCCK